MDEQAPMDAAVFAYNMREVCRRTSHAAVADEFKIKIKTIYRWCSNRAPSAPTVHTTKALMKIAEKFGFEDWRDLWRKQIDRPDAHTSADCVVLAYKAWRDKNMEYGPALERNYRGVKYVIRRIEQVLPKMVADTLDQWVREGQCWKPDDVDDRIDQGWEIDDLIEQADVDDLIEHGGNDRDVIFKKMSEDARVSRELHQRRNGSRKRSYVDRSEIEDE